MLFSVNHTYSAVSIPRDLYAREKNQSSSGTLTKSNYHSMNMIDSSLCLEQCPHHLRRVVENQQNDGCVALLHNHQIGGWIVCRKLVDGPLDHDRHAVGGRVIAHS